MGSLRSDLLRRVLGCLRDHPHDDTVEDVARRLGFVERDAVDAALQVLEQDGLAWHAGEHWQLTRRGWEVAREQDPRPDTD
jgi:DNA-binding IclR family transcriptional regulator